MSSGLVGKKLSHQHIKLAELQSNPDTMKSFQAKDDGKYVLTQVVAGKDWGLGTIWQLVESPEGPILARVHDGPTPEGAKILDQAAVSNKMAVKTAALHSTAGAPERVASGISVKVPSAHIAAVEAALVPVVLDWVEGGFLPTSVGDLEKKADAEVKAGRIGADDAAAIKGMAVRILPQVAQYIEARTEGMFGPNKTVTGPFDGLMRTLACRKPKNMAWGRFANLVKDMIKTAAEKQTLDKRKSVDLTKQKPPQESTPLKVDKTAGGKSKCSCGHTGDGGGSQHEDTVQAGHGKCRMCNCQKFTWVEFLPGAVEEIKKNKPGVKDAE